MDQRISLITLGVGNVDASAAFYERLGWTRAETPPGLAAFDLIGQTLGLYPRAELAAEAGMVPAAGAGHPGVTLSYNARDRDEVERVLAAAEAAGAAILRGARASDWGGYHGFFADPDGHVWEVAHNPFSTLGPDGAFRWNGFA